MLNIKVFKFKGESANKKNDDLHNVNVCIYVCVCIFEIKN